jgi:outer membrane immunogenic protein
MKRMLIAGALALAATGQALSADLPPMAPPPPRAPVAYVPVAPAIYNWSGIYIGINGGYGFGKSSMTGGPLPTGAPGTISSGSYNVTGPLVGGTVGANYQFGQFVLGVEADGDWTQLKGTSSSTGCGGPAFICETDNSFLATVRARAGFAWDRVLFYGTGGGAFGDITAKVPTATGVFSSTQRNFGWTAGAGIEFAITENLTAKAEYLYVDLGNNSCSPVCFAGVASTTTPLTLNVARAGLNFKFNPF